jgi:hypothetical protein
MKHDYLAIAQEFGFGKQVSVSQIQEFAHKVYTIALEDAFLESFERRNFELPTHYNMGIAACCNAILDLKSGNRH